MDQYHYDDGPSSSSAPPPPYSISAPGSGSFAGSFDGPASSSLHPPVPTSSHRASGATPEKTSHTSSSAGGFLDSKRRLADPRSSSAQSLAPSLEDRDGDARRTLLIIYIHGFYGNESSFRSFPAHVHNFLKDTLVESHVIHSKIYPRYKTYKAIDVARDNFSQWLEPHESDKTDVILVGHSMGGILAGEVALMVSYELRTAFSRLLTRSAAKSASVQAPTFQTPYTRHHLTRLAFPWTSSRHRCCWHCQLVQTSLTAARRGR